MTTQCNCDDTCKPTYTMLPIQGFGIAIDSSALPTCKCDGTSGGGSGDGISYSLEEQFTGKYWIDGKKIYQKTVDTGVLPNATIKKIPHGVLNIDRVISLSGYAMSSVEMLCLPYVSPTNTPISIYTETATKSLILHTTRDFRSYPESYMTIQYTCTDR